MSEISNVRGSKPVENERICQHYDETSDMCCMYVDGGDCDFEGKYNDECYEVDL